MVQTRAQTDNRPLLGLSLSYEPMRRFIQQRPNASNAPGSNPAGASKPKAPDTSNNAHWNFDNLDEDAEPRSSSPMDTTEDTSNTNSNSNEGEEEDSDADSEPSSTDSEPGLRRWPPTLEDAQSSARSMKQKLGQLALERKKQQGAASNTQDEVATAAAKVSASSLNPFSGVATTGFDFHRSLDSTDGPGMVGVMVEEDSFSASRLTYNSNANGEGEGGPWRTWQLQRQQQQQTPSLIHDPNRATDLATLGLFAKLPGELRNRIYRLVLVMEDEPYPFVQERETCALGACVHSHLPTGFPGILSTCRQIRAEAIPIFLAENSGFRFDARMVESRCVANWIRALGHHARLVKKLVLELSVYQNLGNLFGGFTGTGTIEAHEVVLTCPSGHGHVSAGKGERHGLRELEEQMKAQMMGGLMVLEIGKGIREKAPEQCKKVEGHVDELNVKLLGSGGEGVGEALQAVVGSDWLADVVWKCRK